MKKITVTLDSKSPKGYSFIVDSHITTEEFKKFKNDYHYFVIDAINSKKPFTFDLENLPELCNDYNILKETMSQAKDIQDWYFLRDEMKKKCTFALIEKLDGSGYFNEVVKRK